MLQPFNWRSTADLVTYDEFKWLPDLGRNVYCVLWDTSLNNVWAKQDLPLGYPVYILQCAEQVDMDWLNIQRVRVPDSKIFVLNAGSSYGCLIGTNVEFVPYYVWHYQLEKIKNWNPTPQPKNVHKKVSVICNRVTQSKLWTFTAAAEHVGVDHCMLKLGTWLEEKNVHNRESSGNQILDNLSDIFWSRYWGQEYTIDEFDNHTQNFQRHTSNLDAPHLRECAINITNESFHYSHMQYNGSSFIWPGPFLSEKTLSCLAAGTAFLSAGQFNVYQTLESLGLKFDYGIDLTWDNDSGNLSRFVGLVDSIKELDAHSAQDIYAMTKESTLHNHSMIWSKEFFNACEQVNQRAAERIATAI